MWHEQSKYSNCGHQNPIFNFRTQVLINAEFGKALRYIKNYFHFLINKNLNNNTK